MTDGTVAAPITPPSADAPAIREALVQALEADLIGPFVPGAANSDEVLPLPPSRWYLAGFLAPEAASVEEDDSIDEGDFAAGDDEDAEETQGSPDPEPKQPHRPPASIGLSVLVPPQAREVTVTATWADYHPVTEGERDGAEGTGKAAPRRGRPRLTWQHVPREPVSVTLSLDPAAIARPTPLPASGGVYVVGVLGQTDLPAAGTRALSLFLVNGRPPVDPPHRDAAYLFQVRLELACDAGFLARADRKYEESDPWDDRVSDLQFRDHVEVAVGHGVSVAVDDGTPARRVRTTWLPRAEVARVVTRDAPGVETRMEVLAELGDGEAARAALASIATAYEAWIGEQARIELDSDRRRDVRDRLLERARRACRRIAAGVELVASDPVVLDAFKLANRAMALAALQRTPGRYAEDRRPAWRLFQLAFLLMNLRGTAVGGRDDAPAADRDERDVVELIFFPTGGGKTEAYLGVIAFTLLLRRLTGQARPDRGLGVAVLLRYTLRLLTLDQLGRAATLVCALETLRRADPERLGDVRFAVGLWVGKSATANTLAEVAKQITEYRANAGRPSPCPLTACPWCGEPLGPNSLSLGPDRARPTEVIVGCLSFRCPFSTGKDRAGIPVVFVDEQVYSELPCFVVATVDKFAMLPWRGETGMLFGRVVGRRGRRFLGPLDQGTNAMRGAEALPRGLLPPELIVQDELHLISGPLGTLVGLYETAIAALCERTDPHGRKVRPKVLAATATVRRAPKQIQALFGRRDVALFPPPAVDDSETFFAGVDRESPGRLYVGVAAPGRAMKAILLRAYVALLAGAERWWDAKGTGEQPADAYKTLVGYFNSLRELGGMRRLVEDEVRGRCAQVEDRRPIAGAGSQGAHPWARKRTIALEPVELTSRESTFRIAQARARLGYSFGGEDPAVDVLLASNMISVGVDIDRLGLMVVAGQPKTTAEYIQASSRVGRDAARPGLVVTCLNVMKPRDRSHYERFAAYHGAFYRSVEATSLTPFSGPALDRGLAGTLVAMTRLTDPALTAPTAAMDLPSRRALAEAAVAALAERGGDQPDLDRTAYEALVSELTKRGKNLLDAWDRLVTIARTEAAAVRCYSRFDVDREGKPLLYTVLDDTPPPPETDDAKFAAPTSMRDVESTVHLWLETGRSLGGGRRG